MTSEQYRHAIEHLGMTQVGSARFFDVSDTTPRRWISGASPIPMAVEMLLCVMVHYDLTPHGVMAIAHRDRVAS
jgi:hypothetical protein